MKILIFVLGALVVVLTTTLVVLTAAIVASHFPNHYWLVGWIIMIPWNVLMFYLIVFRKSE